MINITNIEKAKQEIKKASHIDKNKVIIVKAQSDNFNRKILEYGKFHILLSVESGLKKNKLRQIDSGFNHVLAKIAAKNQVALGLDLKEIKALPKKDKAERLSKITQNIKTCRKTNTMLVVLNSSSKKETLYFFLSLGASTKQAKEASFFN
jgi:RNase P/RNase MRP subunit p30